MSSVSVAPREIRDYVYRATRLTGVDHGIAEQVARAAVFARIHLDSDLENVLGALERREPPVAGQALVAAAEVNGSTELDAGVVAADLAVFAWDACHRDRQVHLISDGGELAPSEWLVGRPALTVEGLRVVDSPPAPELEQVRIHWGIACAEGVPVDVAVWRHLTELARPYLVAETDIDALD